jgi:hypothetical protein
MRSSHVATALAFFTAGLTASAALRRLADRRLAATAATTTGSATAPAADEIPPVPGRDAVVLPFARPALPVPAPGQPAAAVRCGDSGGRTKAGAPCAARASSGGRCHHHPIAA